jgi:hypothetical protein
VTGFPGDGDEFDLQPTGRGVRVQERRSGATWDLPLEAHVPASPG